MFRLPVYNAKALDGLTAVGLDRYVGPDAVDKKAKVVLLSFMASFCGPCKKEMPYLESLHEKYGAKEPARGDGLHRHRGQGLRDHQ